MKGLFQCPPKGRVAWSHQLSKKEASKITIAEVFSEECW